jgi:hypothetical protein
VSLVTPVVRARIARLPAGLLLKAESQTSNGDSLGLSVSPAKTQLFLHTPVARKELGKTKKMCAALQARLAAEMLAAGMGMPSEAVDDMMKTSKRMGIDFDTFGNQRSSKQIILDHEQSLRDIAKMKNRKYSAHMHMSNSWDTKPAEDFRTPPPYTALMPISCEDLKPQTTHRCASGSAGS